MNEHMRTKQSIEMEDGTKVELWQNLDRASRNAMRGVEHLCGLYSPSNGRLIVAGTHLGLNGEEARMESYDLFVVDGGLGAAGACKGAGRDGKWEHAIGFGSAPLRDSTTAAPLSFEEQLKVLEESGVMQCVRSKDMMKGRAV